jgi:hypothetical protein
VDLRHFLSGLLINPPQPLFLSRRSCCRARLNILMPKKWGRQGRESADDAPSRSTNAELAHQVAVLQDGMQDVRKQLEIQFQRIAAIQAELDHLTAKRGG